MLLLSLIKKIQILNPVSWLRIIRFKQLLEKKGLFAKILNYYSSSILRLFYKFRTTRNILNKLRNAIDMDKVDQFWIIRIGYIKKRNFLPYINLDPFISNLMDIFFTRMPFICSILWNIPIREESCQMINIKHFFQYIKISDYKRVINKWYKLLIPGGKLKIEVNYRNNYYQINKLKEVLGQKSFYIDKVDEYDLQINGNITIFATKQKKRISPITINLKQKIKDILLILDQNKKVFLEKNSICIFGYQSKELVNFFEHLGKEPLLIDSFDALTNINEKKVDFVLIQNYLEFCNSNEILQTFFEIRRISMESSPIMVIIPEKKHYLSQETTHLFEKSIILKYIDESNILLESITLSTSFKMIQILLKNQDYFPTQKNDKRIVLLGNYTLRYSYLINARWDAQARAFERLGYNTLILDIKDNSFHYILNRIKKFNPDILWTGGKFVIEFLKKYSDFFKNSNIIVINWLWDVKTPVPFNFKDIIDYMFVTTKTDIPKYQQAYNIDNVNWMPASITPEIIQINPYIDEIYDIGFAGSLDKHFHKKRTKIVDFIHQRFNVKIFKNIYNNLPEYYSQCRIVLGGSPDQKDLELYMSNRIFVCMACSCCFLTNYFKGLTKLAENKKHLLWYYNKDDLTKIITKYLSSDKLREEIGKNARKLAEEKHSYTSRIQNILDIINGKTEEFYGFIN